MIENHAIKLINQKISKETLESYTGSNYVDDKTIELLNSFIDKKQVYLMIEKPYYDSDYLSTYYIFYSRKQEHFSKICCRIHIYEIIEDNSSKENYIYQGSIVLRPTKSTTKMGKTYLSPLLFLTEGHIILNEFKNHILGETIPIKAFPWMKQETDVAVCAHVALWSIIRYFGSKYAGYQDITMGSIVQKTPEQNQRKLPLSDLNLMQISELLKKQDFSPIIVSRKTTDDFDAELFTYIQSGIPLIGCITGLRHSVVIIGHGEMKTARLNDYDSMKKVFSQMNVIDSNELVESIIVNDDSIGPYITISKEMNIFEPEIFDNVRTPNIPYSLKDFDYLVVPLYDRIQFGYRSLQIAVQMLLDEKKIYINGHEEQFNFLEENKKYISRVYICSAKTLKKYAITKINGNTDLVNYIRRMELPKFVWNVDFSTLEEFEENKISAKLIIDTTCCNNDNEPWLLIHNRLNLFIREPSNQDKKWILHECEIDPYVKFDGNLFDLRKMYEEE